MQAALGRLRAARRVRAVPVIVCAFALTLAASGWAFSSDLSHGSPFRAKPAAAVFNQAAVAPAASVVLENPGFIQNSSGVKGWANIRAQLSCTVSATVNVRFHLVQQHTVADDATLNVACTPGTTVRIFSDFLGSFRPDSASVTVSTTALGQTTTVNGNVMLTSWPSTISQLRSALRGSNGAAVAAQLKADLLWRSQHNPKFLTVWVAAVSK